MKGLNNQSRNEESGMTENNSEIKEPQIKSIDVPPPLPVDNTQATEALRKYKLKRIQKMMDGELKPQNQTIAYFVQQSRELQRNMRQIQTELQKHEQMVQTLRGALLEMKAAVVKYTDDIMAWDRVELPGPKGNNGTLPQGKIPPTSKITPKL